MLEFEKQDLNPFQKAYIDSFLEKIKCHSSLSPFPRNISQAKSIYTEDIASLNFGGAILLKQKISSVHRELRKTWGSLCNETDTWLCTAGLSVGDSINTEQVCKDFYVSLYEMLCHFGKEENINYLYVILNPGEYLSTEAMGFWPYVAEIRPHESYDGLFHGILSLTYPPPMISQWTQDAREPVQLAA